MEHEVLIEDTGERYPCGEQETLLNGMAKLGRKGIPLGCRGGGCGVCKVQVTSGLYAQSRPMSCQHISGTDQANGLVLACCVQAKSNLTLKVLGKMHKFVCNIDPSLRKEPLTSVQRLS